MKLKSKTPSKDRGLPGGEDAAMNPRRNMFYTDHAVLFPRHSHDPVECLWLNYFSLDFTTHKFQILITLKRVLLVSQQTILRAAELPFALQTSHTEN